MSGCRIGRVRLKSGGADVRILQRQKRNECAEELLRNAAHIVSNGDVVAYAIVALRPDGWFTSATRSDIPDNMLMNRHALVGMFTEAVRDSLITHETACETFNAGMGFEQ